MAKRWNEKQKIKSKTRHTRREKVSSVLKRVSQSLRLVISLFNT